MQPIATIAAAQQFAGALYNVTLGSLTLNSVMQEVAQGGSSNFAQVANRYYNDSFGDRPPSLVAELISNNLGLTGQARAVANDYLTQSLSSAAVSQRGEVLANALNLFGTLTNDALFGRAATSWNARIADAVRYNGVADVKGAPPGFIPPTTFVLTVDNSFADEGKPVEFRLKIDPVPTLEPVRVDFKTISGTATTDDFISTTGSMAFNIGTATQTVSVGSIQDLVFEPDEAFVVEFSGEKLSTKVRAEGRIADDDPDLFGQGKIYQLTAGKDVLSGRATNDVFVGLSKGTGSPLSTINAEDVIDGGGGTDVLSIQVDATDNFVLGNRANASTGSLSNIEILNVRSTVPGRTATVDASFIQGLKEVNADQGMGDLMITNIPKDVAIGIIGNNVATSGAMKFRYAEPSSDVTLNLSGGTRGGSITNTPLGISDTKKATINSRGLANQTGILNFDENYNPGLQELVVNAESDLSAVLDKSDFPATGATLKITGPGRVDLGSNGLFKSIDASTNSGGVVVNLSTVTTELKGSSGNDEIRTATLPPTALQIDAGPGTSDKLVVSLPADFANVQLRSKYKNFEILSNASGAPIDVQPEAISIAGLRSLEVASDGGGFNLITEGLASTVNVLVDQTKALKFGLSPTAALLTQGEDNIRVTLGKGTSNAPAVDFSDSASLDITGFEALTLVANPGPLAPQEKVGNLTSPALVSTLSSIVAPTLKTLNLAGTAFELSQKFSPTIPLVIDATTLTGNGSDSTSQGLIFAGKLQSGSIIQASSHSDTLSIGSGGSSFDAGSGNDFFRSATVAAVATSKLIEGGLGFDSLEISDTGKGGQLVLADADLSPVKGVERLTFTNAAEVTFSRDSLNSLFSTSTLQAPELGITLSLPADPTGKISPLKADLSAVITGGRVSIETGAAADTIIAPVASRFGSRLIGGKGADTLSGGSGVDSFVMDSDGSVYYANQAYDQIRNYQLGVDTLTFHIATAVAPPDLSTPAAGTNVQTLRSGFINFHGSDTSLAQKFKAVQYDDQLDSPGSLAFFHDAGSTYLYFAGSEGGNEDDQFIQLAGILASQVSGGQVVILY